MSATNTTATPTVSFCQPSQINSFQTASFTNAHVQAAASLSSIGVCRICYEGESKEKLISPCHCTGTMGLSHKSCIETWLGSSSRNKCEICNFMYMTERRPKPLKQWFAAPTHRLDRRNFIGDSVCFCFLTPLAIVSAWLCTSGAFTYSQYRGYEWETAGLAVLAVCLVVIYLVWIMIALRYHSRVIADWREVNQDVHIINLNERGIESDSSSCSASPSSLPSQYSTSSSDVGSSMLPAPVQGIIRNTRLGQKPKNTSMGQTALLGTDMKTRQSLPESSVSLADVSTLEVTQNSDSVQASTSRVTRNRSNHSLRLVTSNHVYC